MTTGAGMARSADSLARVAAELDAVEHDIGGAGGRPSWELRNLVLTGRALLHAALLRCETRGAHTRLEFPDPQADQLHRLVLV
jgi:L-aspartate oxidase